jgi:serine protease Do
MEEAGSGVIVQLDGRYYVLTNRHVISGSGSSDGIRIQLADGRGIKPLQTWVDPDTDVGAISIAAPDLAAAPIGDSDKLEIGDFVLAVGSPFGLQHSVTYGIISARGRHDLNPGGPAETAIRLQDFLQTDAAINPGNSGGPLINLRGEVIGINTAIVTRSGGSEGVGFAIPINMYMAVARQLIAHGKASYAYLGVTLDQDFGSLAAKELGLPGAIGARVSTLARDSPAIASNLQAGDVILQFNNTPVENDVHLVNLVNLSEAGTEVSLVVYRKGQTQVVRVRLGDRAKYAAQLGK